MSDHCLVIAEIGSNHQGRLDTALDMIRMAADCGADVVKFQKRDTSELYIRSFYESVYNSENAFAHTYGSHRTALEFRDFDYRQFIDLAAELGLRFMATAFDIPSVDFLRELGVEHIKIASGSLTHTPLISHAAASGASLTISTGGGSLADVRRAVEASQGRCVGLLHCTAIYPAPYDTLNLGVIGTLKQDFPDLTIGASLHDTSSSSMAVAAYMLGARIIEKHVTLNRAWKGTDHAFSLEPQGLQRMIKDLRNLAVAIGDGRKRRHPLEEPALLKMECSCVARSALVSGHIITYADVAFRSPGGGLPPYRVDELVGKRLVANVESDHYFRLEDVVDHAEGTARQHTAAS